MPVGVLAQTPQCPAGSAAARLGPAAFAPDLAVADLSHQLQATMPGGAAGLRRFLADASADQGMAGRWRHRQ